MSLESVLARGRAAAEARMTSRCTIRRKTDNVVIVDGQEVPEWIAVYTDLPIRVAGSRGEAQARTQSPGEAEIERATPAAHLPTYAENLCDSDLIEVTAGEGSGSVLRVIDAALDLMQQTARRIPVMAVERPNEWSV